MAELIRVDTTAHRAWQGNRELTLPHMQFALLAYFVAHAGVVISNRHILREVWRQPDSARSKTVSMHITWLRQSIGENAKAPLYITSVYGVGYRFEPAMVAPVVPEAGFAGYRLPLRVGRRAPHQTVYDAEDRMVAAGMTTEAAAWLVQAANGALEGAVAGRG